MKVITLHNLYLFKNIHNNMFNKKLIFALIILIMAISSVSASDFNSTDDAYANGDGDLGATSGNISGSLVSNSDGGTQLADSDSDVLTSGQTVYFDASASSDGDGSQSSPYKYLYSSRITSGMTAYFADGVYTYSGAPTISSQTYFIGQSRENTIIRSTYSFTFDLTVSTNSKLILRDMTFDNGHIINHGDVEAENVLFENSVCSYSATSSYFGSSSCGAVIFSSPSSKNYVCNLNLNNCYFKANHAKHGGVIAANYTNMIITNCIFYNSSSNRSGGAIYSLKSNLTISKSSFTQNYAKYGGVIYSEWGIIKLTDSNFTSSTAYSFGGVVASTYTTLTSNNCIYLNYKSSMDSGGAIYSDRDLWIFPDPALQMGWLIMVVQSVP